MKKLLLTAAILAPSLCHSAMIAHYDFSDGNLLDNEVGDSYALTKNGSGVTLNGDGSAQIAN